MVNGVQRCYPLAYVVVTNGSRRVVKNNDDAWTNPAWHHDTRALNFEFNT